jgi:YD repeat-containing protein
MRSSWRIAFGMSFVGLCLTILVMAVGASAASSSPVEEAVGSEQPTTSEQPSPNELKPVRELPELRTANSDTFAQADGSRLLKISLHQLNYKVNGVFQPINDQLEAGADGSSHPVASPTPVSFPATLSSAPVTIGPSAQQLSFALQGASAASTTSGSTSTYAGALPGVDMSYSTSSESVRETLTLASASAPTTYKYDLSLSAGLKASLSPSGGVAIDDAQGKLVYWLAAPTVSDSSSAEHLPWTAPVHYELSADGSVLSLVLSKSWLEDPARVFPVKIDPDVYFGAAQDCSIVNQGLANTSICGERLYVGDNSESPKEIARSLLKFELASIPKGSEILSSSLALWFEADTSSSPLELEAFALNPNQFTQEATWNKYDGTHAWTTPGGDVLKTQAGMSIVKNEYKGGWISIGFTPQVEQWVRDPESNDGILLKAHNETTPNVDTFVQTDNCEGKPEPNLNVIYTPKLGNPGNEAMYQLAVGGGATLGVNVANGNLHVTDPDVRYSSEGYATELGRSYNSQDEEMTSSSFGHEWRSSLGEDELLYPAWWDESYALHQPDGSYTRFDRAPWADNHPSAGDKAYTGEAYVGAGLVVHENGTRTVTEPGGVEWQYDNSGAGFPQKIIDSGGEGNTITLNYTLSHLTKVADTHGHELILTREEGTHYVTKIAGKEKGETWKYTYNKEGQLTAYTNRAKEKIKYTYTKTYGLLESIADEEGTWVMSYDAYGRVASLRKLVNGTVKKAGSEDELTSFSYETEQTTVTNPEGVQPVYYYDQFGNLLEQPTTQEDASEAFAAYAGIEVGAAHADVNLQDHAAILDNQLSSQLGSSYTGEWFDASSEKPIKLGITSEAYERTAEQDLDNLGLADNAEVVTTTHTVAQLEEGEKTVEAALKELALKGLVIVGREASTDSVTIQKVNSLTATQTKEVNEAVSSAPAPVVVIERAVSKFNIKLKSESCANAFCPAPIRGGVSIQEHEAGTKAHGLYCSAGFVVHSEYTGKPYLLTAGHCIKYGGGVGQGWESSFPADSKKYERFIGHAAAYVSSAAGDVGMIAIDPPPSGVFQGNGLHSWVVVYGSGSTARNEYYGIAGIHVNPGYVAPEHWTVCSGAAPTGQESLATFNEESVLIPHESEHCAVTEGMANPIANLGEPEQQQIDGLEQANLCAEGGASGGPVYKAGRAYGTIVSGERSEGKGGCASFYEGASNAQGYLHVKIG